MPGETAAGALVEGGHWWGDGEGGVRGEVGVGGADFAESGALGLVGDAEAGEVGEGWHLLLAATFQKVIGEGGIVGADSGLDDGVVGLVRLNEDVGDIEMATTDATDNLGEEFESAFFGGEVGQGEARIGLDDADGGEVGKVEAAGEGLGADEDVNIAVFHGVVEAGEVVGFLVITVETGDAGDREETLKFRFEELGAETFVDDAGAAATGTAGGDFFFVTTDMAREGVGIGVEGHWEVAFGTKGLPATFFAECNRGGAATIMKNESLMFSLDIVFNSCQEGSGEVAIFEKIIAILEVDDGNFGVDGSGFGFLVEFDEGFFGSGKMIVDDIRGGGAENTRNFASAGHKTSQA